jgi:hypothetical protein
MHSGCLLVLYSGMSARSQGPPPQVHYSATRCVHIAVNFVKNTTVKNATYSSSTPNLNFKIAAILNFLENYNILCIIYHSYCIIHISFLYAVRIIIALFSAGRGRPPQTPHLYTHPKRGEALPVHSSLYYVLRTLFQEKWGGGARRVIDTLHLIINWRLTSSAAGQDKADRKETEVLKMSHTVGLRVATRDRGHRSRPGWSRGPTAGPEDRDFCEHKKNNLMHCRRRIKYKRKHKT